MSRFTELAVRLCRTGIKKGWKVDSPPSLHNSIFLLFGYLHLGLPVSAGGTAPLSAGIMFGFPTKGNL